MSELLRSYEELIATPFTRYAGNPIIPHTNVAGSWKEWQVEESIVFVDPADDSKLLMFYSGARPPAVGGAFIGSASADLAEPFGWRDHPANPLLSPGSSALTGVYIRLDSVLRIDGVYWLYATGMSPPSLAPEADATQGINSIHLARSTDGVHFTWHDHPVLMPQSDERDVSQAAVLKEGCDWYMYYSYRTLAGDVLPGIRLAVSHDGLKWKPAGQILNRSAAGYDSRYYEWHQISKIGRDYVLISECYDGRNWCAGAAHSRSPTQGWEKKSTPLFERSDKSGTFDVHHVATPAIFDVGRQVMLFYQGGNNLENYIFSNWDIGVACTPQIIR